jgi:hypothetical protein
MASAPDLSARHLSCVQSASTARRTPFASDHQPVIPSAARNLLLTY